MNSGTSKAIGAIAFVVGFVAVKYALQLYREHSVVAAAEQSIAQTTQQGVEKHPDLQVSEAVQLEAVAAASRAIKVANDDRTSIATAASTFIGFYLVNDRERPRFCRELGVDISSFVSPFEREHQAELTKARTVLSAIPDASEERLYALLQPQLRKVIDQDMKDISTKSSTSLKGACEVVAAGGAAIAEKMQISKIQPDVYAALMNSK
ncbi:MAG: hypothetical protein ABIQ70_06430 [Dokdonella sp.]